MTPEDRIEKLLQSALSEHNDDCILCAMKDTRVNEALAELDHLKAELKEEGE